MLEEVAKYHDDWVRICKSLIGDYAEDIVQDMYLTLIRRNIKLEDIKYKNTINKYFIYMTLRNLCIDYLRKRKENLPITKEIEETNFKDEQQALDKLYYKIDQVLKGFRKYDRVLFELYMFSGLSLREISTGSDKETRRINKYKEYKIESIKRGSGLSVSSMFNTITQCKQKLKNELGEDFEDFFNGDYELIKAK